MVSQPETGSDSPIGSDRDRGRDIQPLNVIIHLQRILHWRRPHFHLGTKKKPGDFEPFKGRLLIILFP